MSTGAWDIAFSASVLERIGARYVVVAGAHEGIWAALVRGMQERAGVASAEAPGESVRLEAVEWYEHALPSASRRLFDRVHTGALDQSFELLAERPDVIVLGEQLHAWPRVSVTRALDAALDRADYVVVLLPMGQTQAEGAAGGEGDALHPVGVTAWAFSDFLLRPLVRTHLSHDEHGRAFACFVMSARDPLRLGDDDDVGADGETARADTWGVAKQSAPELDTLLEAIADQAFELAYIKKSGSYRAMRRLRESPMLRAIRPAPDREVTIRALGDKNPASQGSEVWLLDVRADRRERTVPWDFVNRGGKFEERADERAPYGKCLLMHRGSASFIGGLDPEVRLLMHPWSGRVEIAFGGRREVVDLYTPGGAVLKVYPARTPMVAPGPGQGDAARTIEAKPLRATGSQEEFLRRFKETKGEVIAVHCPRWLGVTSSTRTLFEHLLPVPETSAEEPYYLTDRDLTRFARVIAEAAPRVVVFSGGDEAHYRLMEMVRRLKPGIRFNMLWHGNSVQWSDDYAWKTLGLWIDAAKDGRLHTLGTVKKGLEQVFAALGARSKFVMNYVPLPAGGVPAPAEIPGPDRHLGLWMSGTLWKTPNVMLSACALLPSVVVHAAGLDERTSEIAKRLGVRVKTFHGQTIPHAELMAEMRRTHLTMYATFTECCPMIPLESLAQGVPAILGPNSHLLEDEPWLFERLVVPFPDRAEIIAKYAERALAERSEIISRYAAYAPGYNERARASVESFLI